MKAIIVSFFLIVFSVNYAGASDWTAGGSLSSPLRIIADAPGKSSLLADGGRYGSVDIYDLAESDLIAEINLKNIELTDICCNSDYQLIALINKTGHIVIYNYNSSQIINEIQSSDDDENADRLIVFSEDGSYLSELSKNTMMLSVYRISDGKLIDSHKIEFPDDADICLSANGHYTSSLSEDTLLIWDNIEKKLLKEIQIPKPHISSPHIMNYSKLSTDGKRFVYRDETDTIRIIDIAKSEIIFSREGDFEKVEWIGLSETANFALSQDFDQIGIGSKIYDVKTGEKVRDIALRTKLININSQTNSYSFLHGGSAYRGTRSPGSSGIISTMQAVDNKLRFLGNVPQFAWSKVNGYSYDGKLMSVLSMAFYENGRAETFFVIDTDTKTKVGRCDFSPVFSPNNKNILNLSDEKIIVYDLFAEPTGESIQPENRAIDSFVVVDERILLLYQDNNCVFYNYTDAQVIRKIENTNLRLIEKGKKYILKTANHVEKYDTYSGNKIEEYELAPLDIPEEYVLLCQSQDYKLAVYVKLYTQTIIYDQIKAEIKYSYEYIYPTYGVYGSKFLFASNNKVLIQTASEKAVENPRDYLSFFEVATGKTLEYYETYSHEFKISGNYEFIGGFLQDPLYSAPVISHKKLNENLLSILSIDETEDENKNESEDLIIFPNPARNNITIELPENFDGSELNISITDMLGREVKSFANIVGSFDGLAVDVSGLNSGVYMITVVSGDEIVRSRFVVAR